MAYEPSPIIRTGPISLDYNRGIVEHHGHTTRLTPIETRLLHILMQNPDRVVSRRELTRVVWADHQPDDDHGSLTVYIHWLRRKLETDLRAPKFIITRPRWGYQWLTTDVD